MSKQARGHQTVERVLDVALEAVSMGGVHTLTISTLSAASGVSVGSLYHHFGARDGVLIALYRRCLTSMLHAICDAVLARTSARDGITALVRAYIQWVRQSPQQARVIYAIGHSDLARARSSELDAISRRLTAPLFAWLQPHVQSGALMSLPATLFETIVIGPASETCRRILAGTPGYSFAEAEALLPPLAWRALKARRPAVGAKA